MLIRRELESDHVQVDRVHREAFGDHGRAVVLPLLTQLRRSIATEPGLSLVACEGDTVVGHVLLTRNLLDAERMLVDVEVLSPVAVRPEHQGRGIGTELIERAMADAARRGVPAVFLEGDPRYYSRVGFTPAADHGFRKPSLRIPDAAFQVRTTDAYAPWMTGTLVYRQVFWDHDAVGLRVG